MTQVSTDDVLLPMPFESMVPHARNATTSPAATPKVTLSSGNSVRSGASDLEVRCQPAVRHGSQASQTSGFSSTHLAAASSRDMPSEEM